MPSLNISFSDDEMDQLRSAAADSEVSLRSFVHTAAVEAASQRKRRVLAAARAVAEHSAELNRRLA